MQHLRLVSLDIADPDGYARYREAMEPMLAAAGGRFVLDVEGRATIHPGAFPENRFRWSSPPRHASRVLASQIGVRVTVIGAKRHIPGRQRRKSISEKAALRPSGAALRAIDLGVARGRTRPSGVQ